MLGLIGTVIASDCDQVAARWGHELLAGDRRKGCCKARAERAVQIPKENPTCRMFGRRNREIRGGDVMRRLLRPRWVRLTGLFLVFLGVTALAAHVLDGPAHRYMEREINRRLTGYTVSVGALHIHPWTVSLELLDSTISQNTNPTPPVARVRSLTATIHWRALLHRKVVADVTFDRPSIYVNLKNLRAEATSDVALKDRGWQEALEAVTLDLKIDRLEVREGDLTYLDGGPFKPLQVSRVNATAENIRNIRSKERAYPSDIHVEGLVFDAGRLWLDGHADFLAEPHATVKAALRLDEIELDYFRPITSRYNVSVTKGTLSLAGNVEYTPTLHEPRPRPDAGGRGARGIHPYRPHGPDRAGHGRARP
mgnify:CR=1 FL=1